MNATTALEGILPVNKPAGFTSHDVVAKVRRILGVKRVGHTGTLDPQVTGVLPLCLGRATRVAEYVQQLPKQYEAELTIGYATDTEDWTGAVVARADRVELSEDLIRKTLQSFEGEIEQIPPMYSAVKVDGKRLYELAREGKYAERKPRTVTIYEIDPLNINVDSAMPTVRFRVRCSKGTYIRTLCADIGRALGYPAVMTDLVRTSAGMITLDQCLSLSDIESLHRSGELRSRIIPTDQAIAHFPGFRLSHRVAKAAAQGKPIGADRLAGMSFRGEAGLVRIYDPDGRFIGVFRYDPTANVLRPEKVFVSNIDKG